MFAIPASPAWMKFANCLNTDADVFYPELGCSVSDAKRVCGRCSVTEDCLDFALVNDERFGVWGGLSERQRRALKRRA